MANTLISKIAQASIKVGALATDKTNEQQRYNYISADKVLDRAGNALASVGVAVIPAILEEQTAQFDYADNYGKTKSRYDAVVRFAMTVTDGEGQYEVPWVGRGSDYAVPDKALYKAITSGHKYFLMKLLNIGVGNEDSEHDPTPDAPTTPQTAQKRPETAQTSNHATMSRKTPQKPATLATAQIEDAEPVDPDGPQRKDSPAHRRMFAIGNEIFGPDWNDGARAWLLRQYTKLATPDNIRDSSTQLSDDEKDVFGGYMGEHATALQGAWAKQKAKQNIKVAA